MKIRTTKIRALLCAGAVFALSACSYGAADGLANASAPLAAVEMTTPPERDPSELQVLFWSDAERSARFRDMESWFAGHEVPAASNPRELTPGAPLPAALAAEIRTAMRETGAAGPRPIVGYGGPGPSASDRRTGTASDAAHLVRNLHALRTQIANGVLSETTSQHVGMLTHDQQNARVAALDLQLARQPRDATLERILFNDRAGEGHERGAAIRSAEAAPDGEPPAQRRRTGGNYNQDMSARNDNTRSL